MKNRTIIDLLSILFLITLIVSKPTTKSPDLPTFQQFKERFHKQYATPQQQQQRKTIYTQNRKEILLNTQCKDCGVNVYSDKTKEERKNQLFGLKVPENFTQIVAQSQHKVRAKLKGASVTYPTALDWRERKAVTKVRNQKGCGACWAFQITAAAQSLLLIQGKGNPNTLDLSQQGLLQCTIDSSCNGGSPGKAAQQMVSGGGFFSESKYPYRPDKFYEGQICSAKKDFPSPAITSANYYGISDQQIIQLLQISPIGVTIDADSLSARYDPTKNPVHKCSVGDNQINHGILLVGYTPTYWIIKNSWGTNWGIDGFAYISRNRANNENCVIHTWITVLEAECSVANCKECAVQNSCGICKDGYYLVPNGSINSCKQCADPNCQTCYTKAQNSALEGRCKICKTDFSLQASTQKCKSMKQINIPNCLVHSADFNTCMTCDDGYVLSNDVKACLKCEVQNCEQCLTGYQDRCKACKPGYSGDKCDMLCSEKCEGGCSAPGVCTKCQDGYTGKNCQVTICIDNCMKCSTPNTCEECEPGYELPNCTPVQDPKQMCSSMIQNCAKGCSKDPNVCDECDKEFYGPQCNIQYVCDAQNCKSIVTIKKPALKSQQPIDDPSYIEQLRDKVQDSIDSTVVLNDSKKREASLTIGMIIVSMMFVFTLGFAIFLVYRLRTIKRINIIQPLESEGSNKSIPYVGKNIV